MARTRKVPSMFRTPGRLYRWNRRYRRRHGEPMQSDVTIASCGAAVAEIRKRTRAGTLNFRDLVVREYARGRMPAELREEGRRDDGTVLHRP